MLYSIIQHNTYSIVISHSMVDVIVYSILHYDIIEHDITL